MTDSDDYMLRNIWYNKQYRYEFIQKWVADNNENKIEKNQFQTVVNNLVEDWLNRRLKQVERFLYANPMDFHIFEKQQAVKNGNYGTEIKDYFNRMTNQTKYIAAWYMLLLEKQGESISLYGDALLSILDDGVLYENERKPYELILYIGKEQNNKDQCLIKFINSVFLPFGYRTRVFWDKSFGIMDQECCGGLNEILLY